MFRISITACTLLGESFQLQLDNRAFCNALFLSDFPVLLKTYRTPSKQGTNPIFRTSLKRKGIHRLYLRVMAFLQSINISCKKVVWSKNFL